MREAISRILRIGIINSGMFDSLELNADVRAVHLVGDNNVGKTSLIELIQFLYFPRLDEMRFSKSLPESLGFYFRPEGSYLLFEVRTVRGTQRTIGIFGTGAADSRQVFVFNGPFDLTDFLDEQRRVAALARVGQRLADRRFHVFTKVEDHERALVGEHSDDRANVQLFDLPRGNFRLLRKLLQNLLRLERLTSSDIRQFLNALVESAGLKTRIDIARDFERKYGEIRAIRDRIAALLRLKPLIDGWNAARDRLEQARADEQSARVRVYHTARRYVASLDEQHQTLARQISALQIEQNRLDEERQRLASELGALQSRRTQTEALAQEHERLAHQCAGQQHVSVLAAREQLTNQIVPLQQTIDRMAATSPEAIERRIQRLRSDAERLRRQRDERTIAHLLADAALDEETQSLLTFLLAEGLLSLPTREVVRDSNSLLVAARTVRGMLDADGTFHGFGLAIARSEWYRPRAQEQPLAERLTDTEEQIAEAEQELAVACDRAQAQKRLADLRREMQQTEELLRAFERLRELDEQSGGEAAIRAQLGELQRQIGALQEQQRPIGERIKQLRDDEVKAGIDAGALERRRADVTTSLRALGDVTANCPTDIAALDASDLPSMFDLADREHRQRRSALNPLQTQLAEARVQLDDQYEREAPDEPFEHWVVEKQRLTSEVDRLESQLRESYTNLLTLVKGELDKLTQAFDAVQSRVAELNAMIRKVSISNIERIELQVQASHLVDAIQQTSRMQLDLFSPLEGGGSLDDAERQIEEFVVGTLRSHGRELSLDDLFRLQFRVTFSETGEQREVEEIHAFESNGTAIGVKIVVYLGLIRLLQANRRATSARIPFFLDEVGSLSSNNVRQIIRYCEEHHFLPIFASPTVRDDIPHSYILRRYGERSRLVTEVILTEGEADAATDVARAPGA